MAAPLAHPLHHLFLFLFLSHMLLHLSSAAAYSIGINYGTLGDNLPPPSQVANFLKTQTIIDRIKIFDTNPDILHAFSNTGIAVTVTVKNAEVPLLSELQFASRWVEANVSPFHPQTRIIRIAVGNEVLHHDDQFLISRLVPAMRTLHHALVLAGFGDIQVSTPHSLGILSIFSPPSTARFKPVYEGTVLAPMLQFLQETKSPFMVNPYPYFGHQPHTLKFALFEPNIGLHDQFTKITYTSMFDAMMDAVYSAMKALGYGDIDIVVAETGWPSMAEPFQPEINPVTAATYNGNLMKHVNSGKGTPLMPNRNFETYIFALFNENLKPGPTAERNFGLFRPDMSQVYDIGIMSQGQAQIPNKKWCVAKAEASDEALQANIDYVCRFTTVDCNPIRPGGACFAPNAVRSHASYLMNSYYHISGRQQHSCDFADTGLVIDHDPSSGTCRYKN